MPDKKSAIIYLIGTIIAGSLANTYVKKTQGFTLLIPILLTICFVIVSFACMSKVMMILPVGETYTIYASSVIVLVNFLAYFMYGQIPTTQSILATIVILFGIALMNA